MEREESRIKLVIDPGHGGDEPGAVNTKNGLKEKDINLNVGLILNAIFETHPEYDVRMTRKNDVRMSLSSRTKFANDFGGRVLSLHCNSVLSTKAHGTEAWCFSKTGRGGEETEGYKIASAIADNVADLGLKNRGAKAIYDRESRSYIFRKLWILRKSVHPAVILECGFVSNEEDAASIDVDLDGFNESVAVAIYKGIDGVLRPQ